MSWQKRQEGDAVRAGLATTFFLLGASVVLGGLEAGPARLVLVLSGPLTALLAGVYVCRSAWKGGR